jgi:two-component system CheB/CheR fusion protein
MEFAVRAADGTPRWYEANGRPIESSGPSGGRAVVVIRDISERGLRRLQEQFVGMVVHELRTPLAGLLGYLQLHLRHLEAEGGGARLEKSATAAFKQAQRLRDLVDELLDLTRLRSGKLHLALERIDLAAVAARAVETAETIAPDRSIRLEIESTPLLVHGDADRLGDVILNLLTNAIRHAPDSEQIDLQLCRVGAEAELTVHDTGPGIPAAELPEIFSAFHQVTRSGASRAGLGLGLFIAREVVTAHAGRLEVSSQEGVGTTFTLYLPLLDGDEPTEDDGDTDAVGQRDTRTR